MQSINVCLGNQAAEQPFVAAAQQLGIDLQISSDLPGVLTVSRQADWAVVSGTLDDIQSLAQGCIRMGRNPRTHLVRVIDQAWGQYFFHDLPVFASVVAPTSVDEAINLLKKLSKAKDVFSSQQDVGADELAQERIPSLEKWVQASPELQQVFQLIQKVANKPVDILVFGETGSGKDVLARYIHQQSGRKGNFVHINCAALPDQLIESELFGVEAGAFTGASKTRVGKIEFADQGTLYLDEIDSMNITCQAKLLTALQERGAERLGGNKFIKSSFRVIASTKVNLTDWAHAGKFRQDLLFRIQVVTLPIPPLRQRLRDIPLLFEFFCEEAARLYEVPAPEIPHEIRAALLSHPWPGNVRELKASAERFVLGMPLNRPESADQGSSFTLKSAMREYERQLIAQSLKQHHHVVADAAQHLGLTPHNLYYRMKILGIKCPSKSQSV